MSYSKVLMEKVVYTNEVVPPSGLLPERFGSTSVPGPTGSIAFDSVSGSVYSLPEHVETPVFEISPSAHG